MSFRLMSSWVIAAFPDWSAGRVGIAPIAAHGWSGHGAGAMPTLSGLSVNSVGTIGARFVPTSPSGPAILPCAPRKARVANGGRFHLDSQPVDRVADGRSERVTERSGAL